MRSRFLVLTLLAFSWIYSQPVFATGGIRITINPSAAAAAGAQWRADLGIIGWTSWYNSGETVTGFAAGPTAVEFRTISGWQKPSNLTVNVTNGGTATGTGTYIAQTGGIRITLAPTEAVSAGAKWRAEIPGYGWTTWYSSGQTVTGFSIGSTAIEFSSVSGWQKPSNINVNVTAGGTATGTGTYIAQTGGIRITLAPTEAVSAGAKWRAEISGYGWTTWYSSGETVTGFAPGSTAIEFSSVTGWQKPGNISVNVTAGGTASGSGSVREHPDQYLPA